VPPAPETFRLTTTSSVHCGVVSGTAVTSTTVSEAATSQTDAVPWVAESRIWAGPSEAVSAPPAVLGTWERCRITMLSPGGTPAMSGRRTASRV
jgi:hypothetical protein